MREKTLTDVKVRERDISDLIDRHRRTVAVKESNRSLLETSAGAASRQSEEINYLE